MGDQMPKEQYDYIKAIQDDCLESTNMTENEAWDFAFRCWQLGYKREKEMNTKNSIPIIEMSEIDKLPEILETLSPSQIFKDRHRPYNGQPWTDDGERGATEVKGVTMRDIVDCLHIALYESCGSPENVKSVYDLDLSNCDPIAIGQNLTCNIEKMMRIFPNMSNKF
jgi:hypothetical protein